MRKNALIRIISLLLCLTLAAGYFPGPAMAEEPAPEEGIQSSEQPPQQEPLPEEIPPEEPEGQQSPAPEGELAEPSTQGEPETPPAEEELEPTYGQIPGGNLQWVLTADGTLTIYGQGGMADFNWTPNNPNVKYDQPWGPHMPNIKTLVVEEGVTYIGKNAFINCANLTSVTLPSTLETMGYSCFDGTGLTRVELPEGLTAIPSNAFNYCKSLTEVIIPESVTAIGSSAFAGCSALKTVELPSGLTRLEGYLFSSCTALETVNIPEGVTFLGSSVFSSCKNLTKVDIPAGVTFLGEGCFSSSGITEITLPAGITEISLNCFNGCDSLASVTVPAGVRSVWDCAFAYCDKLAAVTFAGSAPGIAPNAFYNVTATVHYPENYASWDSARENYGGKLTWEAYTKEDADDQGVIASGAINDSLTWTLTEDGKLTVSGTGAMADFSWIPNNPNYKYNYPWGPYIHSIRCVVVEEGVTYIGNYAFHDCTNLTSVTLPSTLESMGGNCFYGTGLIRVELPSGLASIPGSAFGYCQALTEVIIPESVTSIATAAFSGCSALKTVELPSGLTRLEGYLFSSCTALESVNIPDGVTWIGTSVFNGCKNLTKVDIPAGVTFLGEGCFSSSGITEITLPAGITEISLNCFNGCDSLASVTIPASVRSVWDDAFAYSDGLASVTFLGSAPGIAPDAFYNVTATVYYPENYASWDTARENYGGKLTWQSKAAATPEEYNPAAVMASGAVNDSVSWSLTFGGKLTVSGTGAMEDYEWTPNNPNYKYSYPWGPYLHSIRSVEVEEGVTYIGKNAFYNCVNLTSVTLPSTLETMGYSCFDGTGLTRVELPHGLTAIPGSAFNYCKSLTEVIIPESVTAIGSSAFAGCSALKTVALPSGLTRLEGYLFSSCTALESVNIPDGVTWIGNSVFSSCKSLTEVDIPAGVTFLGEGCFSGSGIKEIRIPALITEISLNCFNGCDSLTTIIIPAGVRSVWGYAFAYCDELATVTFAGSAPGIESNAFTNVTATAYHPANYASWDNARLNYGGTLTWMPFNNGLEENYDPYEIIAWGVCGDSMGWVLLRNGTARISGHGRMHEYTSAEDAPWAEYAEQITSLEVNEGVESISSNAFAGTENLQTAQLPASLEEVGSAAFAGCTALETITFSGSAPTVGEDAFQDVSATVYAPKDSWTQEEMDALGSDLTWGGDLTSGSCGENVTWEFNSQDATLTISGTGPMSDYAFSGNTLRSDAPWAGFAKDVKRVEVEAGVTRIGAYAFLSFENMHTLSLPDTLTALGDQALAGCSSLKSLHLPDSLDTLGEMVFEACTGVESLHIGTGFNQIAQLQDMESLLNITLSQGHKNFMLKDGVLFTSEGKKLVLYPRGLKQEYYEIPQGTTTVGSSAFQGATSLTFVTFPESVEEIGGSAFQNCTALSNAALPKNIRSVGNAAFMGCTSLSTVYVTGTEGGLVSVQIGASAFRDCTSLFSVGLPFGTYTIGASAFENCVALDYLTFPVHVRSIGGYAFSGSGLTGMEFFGPAPTIAENAFTDVTATVYYPSDRDGWDTVAGQNYGGNLNNWVPMETLVTGTWGDNITWTHDRSYKTFNLSGTGRVAAPAEGEEYPWSSDLWNVREVTVEEGITALGSGCFRNCWMTDVTLPQSLEIIDAYAFQGCNNLRQIVLPQKLQWIGDYAFASTGLTSVTIPDSVTTLQSQAFAQCYHLKEVNLGSGLDIFGSYVFWECDSLVYVSIAPGMTVIPKGMFQDCRQLAWVDIPASVQRLELDAFAGCLNLSRIAFLGSAPAIDDGAFIGVNHATAWYPGADDTWANARKDYGGSITWQPWEDESEIGLSGSCGKDARWVFDMDTKTLTITGTGSLDSFYNADEADVTFTPWRHLNGDIRRVGIGEGITTITPWTFAWLENLTEVTFPTTISRIERHSFLGTGLTEVTIPSEQVYLQWETFGRTPLKKVTFAGRASIDAMAFSQVTAEVYYPSALWQDKQLQDYGGRLTWIPYGEKAVYMALSGDVLTDSSEYSYLHLDIYPRSAMTELSFALSDPDGAVVKQMGSSNFQAKLLKEEPVVLTVTEKRSGLTASCTLIPWVYKDIPAAPYEETVAVEQPLFGTRYRFTPAQSGLYVCLTNNVTQPGWEPGYASIQTAGGDWVEPVAITYYGGISRVAYQLEAGAEYIISDSHGYAQVGQTLHFRFFRAETEPDSVTIYPDEIYADADTHLELMATTGPEDTAGTITWTSSDPDIVEIYWVDAYSCGYHAKAPGTAVITASCGTGSDSVTVHVGDLPQLEVDVPLTVKNYAAGPVGYRSIAFTAPQAGLYAVTVENADTGNWMNARDLLVSEGENSFTLVRNFEAGEQDILGLTMLAWEGDATVTIRPAGEIAQPRLHVTGSYEQTLMLGVDFGTGNALAIKDFAVSDPNLLCLMNVDTSIGNFRILRPGTVTVTAALEDGSTCALTLEVGQCLESHDFGPWQPLHDALGSSTGHDIRFCNRCDRYQTVTVKIGSVELPAEDLPDVQTVWIDGREYPVVRQADTVTIAAPEGSTTMTAYTMHIGDPDDIHTHYPTGMQVWLLKWQDGVATPVRVEELDDIMQYSGSSIRITGNKGIRMITSVDVSKKSSLTGDGLAELKLLEYGTLLCWKSDLEGGNPMILGQPYSRSNYAYRRDVADPVFAYAGNLVQYTNVLVGFSLEQCADDIAMRPYMILEDAQGNQYTIYGGIVYRSIGYIAWQNRTVFAPGTASYDYVWEIIHSVYGDAFDSDYTAP